MKHCPHYMPCAHYNLNCVRDLSKLEAFNMSDQLHLIEILTSIVFQKDQIHSSGDEIAIYA